MSFLKIFKSNDQSFDEHLNKRNLKYMMNVLKSDSNTSIQQKVNAAEFLGTVTNQDLKKARIKKPIRFNNIIKPETNFKGDYNPISRLIVTLGENNGLSNVAANSLVKLVERYNKGEKIDFFHPCDLIFIGSSLMNIGDKRGKEILIEALNDNVLSKALKVDDEDLAILYGWSYEEVHYDYGRKGSKPKKDYDDVISFNNTIIFSLYSINDYIILDFIMQLVSSYEYSYDSFNEQIETLISQKINEGWLYPQLFFNEYTLEMLGQSIRASRWEYIEKTIFEREFSDSERPIFMFIRDNPELLNDKFKTNLLIKKQKEMVSNGSYTLIENYVSKYEVMDKKSFENLHKILKNELGELSLQELLFFIHKEHDKTHYNIFKAKMLQNNPKTIEDYLNNFINFYNNDISEENLRKAIEAEENVRKDIESEDIKYYFMGKLGTLFLEKHNSELTGNYNYNLERLLIEDKVIYDVYQIEYQLFKKLQENLEQKDILKLKNELTGNTNQEWVIIDELDILNGYEFENFLKMLFEEMGFEVEHTNLSGDQGADLIISKHGEKTAVQAKRYQEKVNNKAIQEVVASIAHYNVHKGMVVTNSEFTQSAIDLAKSNNIDLINRSDLKKLIKLHPIKKID